MCFLLTHYTRSRLDKNETIAVLFPRVPKFHKICFVRFTELGKVITLNLFSLVTERKKCWQL